MAEEITMEKVNVISSGGRFETRIGMTGGRASATRPFLPVDGFGRNQLPGTQIAGSIALLVVLLLSLFFGLRVTSQLMPLRIRFQRRENNPEIRRQTKVSDPSDGIAAPATPAHGLTAGLPQAGGNQTAFASSFANSDCHGRVPASYTRIFIAYRSDTKSGTGTASDPFDGSAPQRFDTLLRTRSEAGVTNLVVCIGPGTFETEGVQDYVVGVGHMDKTQSRGFTVNRGWRIHGTTTDRTILKLADLYLDPWTGKYLVGRIISTYGLDSDGVEVSDLTLDDNYPALKPQYKTDLQLEAVSLRSNRGQHWIHNLHFMNAAGEWTEAFPVEISSPTGSPTASTGNIVEYVTMDHWAAGKCTAIAIANAVTEVRYNKVIGHQIAYRGWQMSNVRFHDNDAIDGVYGFNIDSLVNCGVVINHNQIVHPRSYGMVIGGAGRYVNFSISDNTVILASPGPLTTLYGLIFQGNVTGLQRTRSPTMLMHLGYLEYTGAAQVIGNRIVGDQTSLMTRVFGLYEKGSQNTGNVFQSNQIERSFKNFLQMSDCVHGNVDQSGAALHGLRNTQSTACLPQS